MYGNLPYNSPQLYGKFPYTLRWARLGCYGPGVLYCSLRRAVTATPTPAMTRIAPAIFVRVIGSYGR